jgi:PiT family inorganic phosphate transporter
LIAIWIVYSEGSVLQQAESPIWILFIGGLGMALGMWIFGERVNDTVGKNITKITATT